jgi:hypothetical protein
VQQIQDHELVGQFDDIGVVGPEVRATVEKLGVTFAENVQGDEAGPTQYAAIALDDRTQFLLVQHYAHPQQFIDVRGRVDLAKPRDLCRRFAEAAGIDESDFSWISEDWTRPGPLPS